MGTGEVAAGAEAGDEVVGVGEFGNGIAGVRVGFDREDLAVDAEGADAVGGAVAEGGEEGVSVGAAERGQAGEARGPGQTEHGRGGGVAELDGFADELAAEAKARARGHGGFHGLAGGMRKRWCKACCRQAKIFSMSGRMNQQCRSQSKGTA